MIDTPDIFYEPATPRAYVVAFDDAPGLSLGDRRRSYRRLPVSLVAACCSVTLVIADC